MSEIRIGRKVVTPAAEVVFALGMYLCLRAGERISREELTEVFWGEGREPQGRHSLRQMLYRLRQKGLTLDEDGEELYLDPSRVQSDMAAALEEGWPSSAEPAQIDAAGLLAPGFTRVISERFQEWFDGIRDRLAAQHRRAAIRQIALARREGRWADLDRWALQVLRFDPLNEEATLARAESAAISGSKAVALEIIDAYMEELGDRASVIGLPATMLRRRIAERKSDWSGRGRREVPLVGRRELMSRLTGYVDAAGRGEGSSVLLWGAPGIGKTRLAEEACAYAAVEGFRTIVLRATKVGGSRPLALLLSLLPELRQLPGALGCDPSSAEVLDVVGSREQEPRTSAKPPFFDHSLLDSLVHSLHDLLDAISAECRLVLVTDDLHNADSSSIAILGDILAERHSHRIAWIGTSRNNTARSASSNHRMTPLWVSPLDSKTSHALAVSFLGKIRAIDPQYIADAAGGNPLFVRELSAHPRPLRSADDIPQSLNEIIATRLATLEGSLLRVLRVVTLLGDQATVLRLHRLCSQDGDLPDQLDTLEGQGILRFSPSRTVELHECWYQSISNSMTGTLKAALALECATLLSEETPASLASTWRAAALFSEVGEHVSAVRLYRECAEELLSRGLPAEASSMAERTHEIAQSPAERVQLLSLRARAENALGHIEAVTELCDEGIRIYREGVVGDLDSYTLLVALQADAYGKVRRENPTPLSHLADLVVNDALPPATREFGCLQGIANVYASTRSPLESVFLESARRSMALNGESILGLLVELMNAAEHGDLGRIKDLERRCTGIEHVPSPIGLRIRALFTRAAAQRFVGDLPACTRLAEQAFELASKLHLAMDVIRIANFMTFANLDQENYEEAMLWLGRRSSVGLSHQFPQSAKDIVHARARIFAQKGDFQLGLEEYEPHIAEIEADPLALRRVVDMVTVAVCAAGSGLNGESERLLNLSTPIIVDNRAGIQLDYIMDSVVRCHTLLGADSNAVKAGAEYMARRAREFPAPLPPAHRRLRPFLDALVLKLD